MAGALKGITVEIGGDTTKLGKALSDVNSKSKSLQSELKGVNSLLKMDPKNVDLLKQKQELLTKAIANTKEKLDTLKEAQAQAQAQFERGEITEEQYRDLQREIVATEQKLNGLTDELKEFGSVGAQQIAEVGEKIKDVGGKVEEFGKGFSKVSMASGALLAGSVASFVELDEGYDTIITKTGATGEALEELNSVADNIFGSMPTDMTTVGTAIGEINTRFGYTGQELEDLSRKFIQFAEINEVDLNNSIGTTDKILEQFNLDASESASVLDLVTAKAQETGIGADKLLDSIQQNGATFKDMNLGVYESIELLAQFEANGVNVDVALKGLKKATTEYADEGLSMSEALGKTIDKIKNAKTETDALAEAQEIFGTKGAGEMAKAIRENRINVDDLTVAMEKYGGTVESTYEGTLDPIDNAKVAMNNLKLAGSELANSAQSVFAPMLTALVGKLRDLVSWFGNLSDGTKKTIVVTLAITTALGPLIIGIGKLITAIGTIATTVPKVVSAFTKLKALIVAHPWLALATALGVLVGGIIAYSSSTKDATNDTDKLCNEIDAFNKKITEQAEAYDEAKRARDETVNSVNGEYRYYSKLADELSNITDENGKVIKGYEARANTITGILSDALGEEITTDQLVADGKQKVIDKINDLILVKKAEAQLSTYQESYNKAKSTEDEDFDAYMKAQSELTAITEELANAEKKLADARSKVDNDPSKARVYATEIQSLSNDVDRLSKSEKTAQDTFDKTQTKFLEGQATIKNYEGVLSATIEGDTAKINDSLNLLVNNFISAENGTKQSLEQQVKNAKTHFENVKLALEQGSPGVTQQMVDNAKDMVNKAETELKKLEDKGKKAGKDGGQGTADGLNSKKGEVKKAGENVSSEGAKGESSKSGEHNKAGKEGGQEYADGVKSKARASNSAGTKVASESVKGESSKKAESKKAGADQGQAHADGMTSKTGATKTAGKKVAQSGKDGAGSVSAHSTGVDFSQGFINGMGSLATTIWNTAWNLGKKALSALKEAQRSASPAKETIELGGFFGEGYVIGVGNWIEKSKEVAKKLGIETVNALAESEDKIKAFDPELKKIQSEKDLGVIDEKTYYEKLKYLRDNFLTEYSDKWYEVSKDIYSYIEKEHTESQNKQLEDLKRRFDRGVISEREYYNKLAVLRDNFYEQGTDDWYKLDDEIFAYNERILDDFIESAKTKLEEVATKRDELAKRLSDHGGLTNTVTIYAGDEVIEYSKLADMDEQTAQLEEYADMLQKVKERGDTPPEFFQMLRDMSIEEALPYVKALLGASDEEYDKYVAGWKAKQEASNKIAKALYEDEANTLTDEILESAGELPLEFSEIGADSATQFGNGFVTSLFTFLHTLKNTLSETVGTLTTGFTFNLATSLPQMANGGIVDRPTVVQVGEDGKEAIIPLEKNTGWINEVARRMTTAQSSKIVVQNDGLADRLDKIYDRLDRMQMVLDSGTLVGEIIDKVDSKLADKQLLNARGV